MPKSPQHPPLATPSLSRRSAQCVGPSMLPTFNQGGGDVVLCEHLTTRWGVCRPALHSALSHALAVSRPLRTGTLRHGDVVVANSLTNPRQTVCKRCVGGLACCLAQPDDARSACWASGASWCACLTWTATEAPRTARRGCAASLHSHPSWTSPLRSARQIPPHHVWLQGDNTRNSNDSRHYGPVPLAMLRGRVCFRFWPLSRAGAIYAEPARCTVVACKLQT